MSLMIKVCEMMLAQTYLYPLRCKLRNPLAAVTVDANLHHIELPLLYLLNILR
jgi:hypothetical protein